MAPCWPHLVAFLLPSIRVLRTETLAQDTRDWLQTSPSSRQAATEGHETRLWGVLVSSGESSRQEKRVYYHLIWVKRLGRTVGLWDVSPFPLHFLYQLYLL